MKTIAKWVGIVFACLIGLAVVGIGYVYAHSSWAFSSTYSVAAETPEVPSSESAIQRGKHIATIRGCADCHGEDFGGKVVIDDPAMGLVAGPNLTAGTGGIGDTLDPKDWTRAIRHGVGRRGRPLLFMPSEDYAGMSDRDLADLIAYMQSLSPVDRQIAQTGLGPMARFLWLTGSITLAADAIDHDTDPPDDVDPAPTAEYGEYLADTCIGCHGHGLSGGPIPGVPPSWPKAANITPHEKTGIADYTKQDFLKVMNTGEKKNGDKIKSKYMPWKNFRKMTDTEKTALWKHLQTVEPKPQGNR